jgi:hypothetical protein
MTNLVPFGLLVSIMLLKMREKEKYGQQKVYHAECLVMIMKQREV